MYEETASPPSYLGRKEGRSWLLGGTTRPRRSIPGPPCRLSNNVAAVTDPPGSQVELEINLMSPTLEEEFSLLVGAGRHRGLAPEPVLQGKADASEHRQTTFPILTFPG